MPTQTDRYPADPLNGAAQMKDWMSGLERRISALEGQPLKGSNLTILDSAGGVRILLGLLSDGTYGEEIDGGKVRALDVVGDTIFSTNVTTLTTLAQRILTLTFVPPVWAVHALVVGWATIQISDTTGAANLLTGQMSIDGNLAQRVSQGSSDPGQTTSVSPLHARNLAAPLSNPIDVHAEAYLSTGTNAANRFNLAAFVLYTR